MSDSWFRPVANLLPRLLRVGVSAHFPRPLPPKKAAADNCNATPIDALAVFKSAIASRQPHSVLEVGTAQSVPGISTHSMRLFPGVDRSQYTMVDILAGPDVDVVANLHALPSEWTNRYDAFIACAVFEHLERPWIAAREVERILAPGGICYISTHQTFPLHGYPQDYFRFSREALGLIFSDTGLELLAVTYAHRCKIILPPELLDTAHLDTWNETFPSYALVKLTARKRG
jgi:SAM-dependent methyltransferase